MVLGAVAAAIYWPAMNRVFVSDQLWYFAEVGGHDSLALGLRHVDYAISRVYWKGDDLLFRPILFTWLAVANRLLSYHHVWWNLANLAIHVGVAVAMLRLLPRGTRRQPPAAPWRMHSRSRPSTCPSRRPCHRARTFWPSGNAIGQFLSGVLTDPGR